MGKGGKEDWKHGISESSRRSTQPRFNLLIFSVACPFSVSLNYDLLLLFWLFPLLILDLICFSFSSILE